MFFVFKRTANELVKDFVDVFMGCFCMLLDGFGELFGRMLAKRCTKYIV